MAKKLTKQMIKRYRKKIGMSQAEFALFMGVSIHCIQAWEQKEKPTRVPLRLRSDIRTMHLTSPATLKMTITNALKEQVKENKEAGKVTTVSDMNYIVCNARREVKDG